ncbi:hypothetical protein CHLNCDRAFT_55152 [Chlorella variabilis]|uniref:Nucleotide-diphospho-sugar transferase domain-containing protein n=1 Tax=Chlorella variabilis TaxID=554065 RepID=E1ZRZ7_CHLVA|nr:hypothetical protein CHLNCDRAFT_55152 [Chlorella variabilis]EFN51422.1 hypothetical protein CHLNCDRAFT_55152 [Chlorella variabilis]|eukprot:XP_005843524.1 hypothetical protein CHLNCDRAFT_55152 [Chlorella variabilis]
MTQNSIYSMVKFGGVRNYVVGCWTPEDLAACADLNLPCTDVARFLPEPMNNAPDAGTFNSHDYLVVCWLRPALLVHLLGLGYAVLSTDSDIVYFVKPVWQSYLRFIEEAGADGAFQAEVPVNGGNYVVLPTPAAIRWAQAWAALAPEMIQRVTHDQSGFRLVEEARWKLCGTVESCQGERAAQIANATAAASPGGNATAAAPPALLRIYLPRYFGYWDDLCAFAAMHRLPRFDPCDWAGEAVHTDDFSVLGGGAEAQIANATAAVSPGGNATAAAPPAFLGIYLPRYLG